jgi:hypothetical protein
MLTASAMATNGPQNGIPPSVTLVVRCLEKTKLRNDQGARRLLEHQNNRDLTPINRIYLIRHREARSDPLIAALRSQ